MPKCKYESRYGLKFACEEPSITNSKFCFFHDKYHYAEHEREAAERFEEKVQESIENNEPLVCIGYYLPDINFAELLGGKSFEQPVYFIEARFYGRADFSSATFFAEANFEGAVFSKEANFEGAVFSKGAVFSGAVFSGGPAVFSGAVFSGGPAVFSGAVFSGGPAVFYIATFSKGADFSGATFTIGAVFSGAKFPEGPALFPSATFSQDTNFSGAVFSKGARFSGATFSEGLVDFSGATFTIGAVFSGGKFLAEARFLGTQFKAKTLFRDTLFEQQNKVTFDDSNLSNVSFADSDITRIRFADGIKWGGKDRYTIIEEEWLKRKAQVKNDVEDRGEREEVEEVRLELVLSVYRNLRENYEFRLRYDEAGEFFKKEMELKRNYREIETENGTETKKNGWLREHFSLTGLYYHLSRYGESISRPAIIAAITVVLSTLFWIMQSNPTLEPNFPPTLETVSTSTFVGFREIGNAGQWLKGFERSLADFLPLLSLGGDIKVGIIDYIIKIFGGGLTFVLLAIALRRKFERKYTR